MPPIEVPGADDLPRPRSPILLRVPASKVVVPELPAESTPRLALRQRLDLATAAQVIVVSAPAGSGKTILLADWVRQPGSPATAWVTVDADDNDPRRLWSAVLTALSSLPAVAAEGRRDRPAGERPDGDLVDEVVAMLDACPSPIRLVLDDVQELTGADVLRDLNRLVRLRPAGAGLVLAARSDPPISIPRLRLEGRVHEVRADALRFSLAETTALLDTAGLQLRPAEVAVLHERTEGWVAGLRLAALALRRTDDVTAFLASFSGDERSVAEYLTGEVLHGLGADMRLFLELVSVCSPLDAELAAELTGRVDADRVLDELHHETALVERTSPGHYLIHPLLRSYLVADLARHRPESHRALHAAAARWWSAREEPVHALRHAERAGNPGLLAELLHRSGVALLLRGDLGPLARALTAVGDDARSTDPRLALLAAIGSLDAGALPAAVNELRNARDSWPAEADGDLSALRASAELLASARGLPDWTFDLPGDDDEGLRPELAAVLHASRGAALFGSRDAAQVGPARVELHRALALARAQQLGYLEVQCLWMLAALAGAGGDHQGMAGIAEQAVAAATQHGRHPSPWTAGPVAMLAHTDLLRGDPGLAAARSAEVLALGDGLPPEAVYVLRTVHGAALADQGDRPTGFAEMTAARAQFGDRPAPAAMIASLVVLEHQVAVLNGNLDAAVQVGRWLAARAAAPMEMLLLKARMEAARGRHEAARTTLAPVHAPGRPGLQGHTLVEARLIEAEAALHADERPSARRSLEAALADAADTAAVRPLALAGPLTQELLDAWLARDRGAFAASVTAARAAIVPDPAVLLSERELAVLGLLPSLLSAREIATEFTVSVNTVKSHIRSIYSKMGVSTRRDAVAAARGRGLLR